MRTRYWIVYASLITSFATATLATAASNVSVTVTAPSPAAGSIAVEGTAKGGSVVRVEIFVDGTQMRSCDGRHCTAAWNTIGTRDGEHTVKAQAVLRDGRVISSQRNVVVANDAPTAVDLSVDGVTVSSATLAPGTTATTTVLLRNNSSILSDSAVLDLRLSASTSFDTSTSTRLSLAQVGTIAPETTSTYLVSITIPASTTAGTYQLFAALSTPSPDAVPTNNIRAAILQVAMPTEAAPLVPWPDQSLKAYLDSEYTANKSMADRDAASGAGATYYYFKRALVGWLAAYEAFGDITYLQRVLGYAETMVSKATNTDSCGKKSWSGSLTATLGSCSITSAAQPLEETEGATELAGLVAIIKNDSNLNATYGSRADLIAAWLHTHFVQKWVVYRAHESWFKTRIALDVPILFLNTLVSMDRAGYANTPIRTGLTYRQYAIQLLNLHMALISAPTTDGIAGAGAEIPSYKAYPAPGDAATAYCGYSLNTVAPCSADTSHFNRWPPMMQRAVDAGFSPLVNTAPTGSTLAEHVVKLERLFSQIIWDKSTTAPNFRNYIDSANGYYRDIPPWQNGYIAQGWAAIAHHRLDSITAATAMLICVQSWSTCTSISKQYNGGVYDRAALAGLIAHAQKRYITGR